MGASRFFDYGTDTTPAPEVPKFLDQASTDDWALVGAHSERRRFRTGEVIVKAGDLDRSLMIVLDGELETSIEKKGRQHRLSPAPAGTVVGELGFLDGRPRSANVIATMDGELLRMSVTAFDSLAAANPRLGRMILFDLGCVLAHRLRALTDVVAQSR